MPDLSQESVDTWYEQWQVVAQQIHIMHSERNKEVAVQMTQAIAHYEAFIDEELLPTNGKERLAFIKARPGQYACYRQLDELYKETKKRIARVRIQRSK